ALSLDEPAGDLAGGVHLLFVIDGERKEVHPLPRRSRAHGGGEHHRVAVPRHHRTVGPTPPLASFQAELAVAKIYAALYDHENSSSYRETSSKGVRREARVAAVGVRTEKDSGRSS